jgi:hypothetical protein
MRKVSFLYDISLERDDCSSAAWKHPVSRRGLSKPAFVTQLVDQVTIARVCLESRGRREGHMNH